MLARAPVLRPKPCSFLTDCRSEGKERHMVRVSMGESGGGGESL